MDASPRVHARCRTVLRHRLILGQRPLGDALDGDAHSLNAAQSLDAAFITAITSSGWAAARPSSCSTTASASSHGRRGVATGLGVGWGAKSWRLRCGQRVSARKLENPFSHTYPLCKSFGFADREKYV
jgi:hypothetical protein